MKIRVEIIGTGEDNNSYRADLPTYYQSDFDYINGTVIVDVPDHDIPSSMLAEKAGEILNDPKHGKVRIKASAKQHEDWYTQLDVNYQELAGKFRPKVK